MLRFGSVPLICLISIDLHSFAVMPPIIIDPNSRTVCIVAGNNNIAGVSTVQFQEHFASRFERLGAGDGCVGSMVSGIGRRFGTYCTLNRQVSDELEYRRNVIVGYVFVHIFLYFILLFLGKIFAIQMFLG